MLDFSDIKVDEIDYLAHHGILGQKWGIRRFQNKDGTLTAAGKKKKKEKYTREDKKRLRDVEKRNLQKMSDDQLNRSIDRMTKEKKLKDLTEKAYHPGKAKAKEIMSNVGDKVLVSALTGLAMYGASWLIRNKLGGKEYSKKIKERKENLREKNPDRYVDDLQKELTILSNYVAANPNKKK